MLFLCIEVGVSVTTVPKVIRNLFLGECDSPERVGLIFFFTFLQQIASIQKLRRKNIMIGKE